MTAESNILFLYGNDEYAISRRLNTERGLFANPSEAEMNTAQLDARSMTDDQWNNAVNAMPFLAAQRLVILSDPSGRFSQRRSKAGADEAQTPDDGAAAPEPVEAEAERPGPSAKSNESAAKARAKFLESLEHIPPSTRLIMWELTDPRGAEKHWLAKWLREKRLGVELLVRPNDQMMSGWITKEAKSQGGEFAPGAAEALVAQVGSDTRQAAQEVTKLLTYVGGKRPVTAADVQALTPHTAEAVIWDLVDALAAGNGKKAQSLLHRFLDEDGDFYVWSMIIRQFRLMLLAREVLDAGGGVPEAMKALRSAEYPAKKAVAAARHFNMPRLEQIYHRLLEIDEAAKTGGMPLDVALDVLVAEQTH
ncbi:MAG TPA: DNA polymerase III subunit delta [Anaerolineales bacterium]|nr:DNA polymerase III subunit delta [Anaerolineales bacterium]